MPTNEQMPTEAVEQEWLVQWLNLRGIKHTAIPNSTYTKSWSQKIKNKKMGLCPGLPDLVICTPRTLLFIEMKRVDGGVVSQFQKEWIEQLNKYCEVKAFVAKGFEEAKKIVEDHL